MRQAIENLVLKMAQALILALGRGRQRHLDHYEFPSLQSEFSYS